MHRLPNPCRYPHHAVVCAQVEADMSSASFVTLPTWLIKRLWHPSCRTCRRENRSPRHLSALSPLLPDAALVPHTPMMRPSFIGQSTSPMRRTTKTSVTLGQSASASSSVLHRQHRAEDRHQPSAARVAIAKTHTQDWPEAQRQDDRAGRMPKKEVIASGIIGTYIATTSPRPIPCPQCTREPAHLRIEFSVWNSRFPRLRLPRPNRSYPKQAYAVCRGNSALFVLAPKHHFGCITPDKSNTGYMGRKTAHPET